MNEKARLNGQESPPGDTTPSEGRARNKNVDVGARRAESQEGNTLRATFLALAVFYLAAALLNGRHLQEGASKRHYGRVRDAWVAATKPLSTAATSLYLDRFRDQVEKIRSEQ